MLRGQQGSRVDADFLTCHKAHRGINVYLGKGHANQGPRQKAGLSPPQNLSSFWGWGKKCFFSRRLDQRQVWCSGPSSSCQPTSPRHPGQPLSSVYFNFIALFPAIAQGRLIMPRAEAERTGTKQLLVAAVLWQQGQKTCSFHVGWNIKALKHFNFKFLSLNLLLFSPCDLCGFLIFTVSPAARCSCLGPK